jgi:hypothetical protein
MIQAFSTLENRTRAPKIAIATPVVFLPMFNFVH